MKKLIILLLSVVALSCKNDNPEPEKKIIFYERAKGESSIGYSTCVYDDMPAPTDYTGLYGDSLILTIPGYGLWADSAYDKGYKNGYDDALYYQESYEYIGYPNCGTFSMYRTVKDGATGQTSNKPLSYTLKPGETSTGVGISLSNTETCAYDFLLKRCVLLNSGSPKALRLQYAFNKNYYFPGKTAVQQSYDAGRWQGFYNGVNLQPLTP